MNITRIAWWVFCGLALLAQQPSVSIEGTVLEASTGRPVAEIEVTARRPTSASLVSTKTDAAGRYKFTGLDAGNWRLFTRDNNATGHLPGTIRIRLEPGQARKDIDLKLHKTAVLSGRVLDSDGDPVEGAMVSVRAEVYREGRPSLGGFSSRRTNDLGEFRIPGLWPARYYVLAELPRLEIRTRSSASNRNEAMTADARTYYVNSPSKASATPVVLGVDEVRQGSDIILRREKTVCVTGEISTGGIGSQLALEQAGVTIAEPHPMSQGQIAFGVVDVAREFEVCGLPPGAYRVQVRAPGTGGRFFHAARLFGLEDRPIRLLPLVLSPLQTVQGRVSVAGARQNEPLPGKISVALEPRDRLRFAEEAGPAQVSPSGDFVIAGAYADWCWLHIRDLPPGYYVRKATIATTDVYREAMLAGSGPIDVVLGDDGPSVSGQVTDGEGNSVSDAVVVLAAASSPEPLAPNLIRTTPTDDEGRFSLTGMPPGDYRIMALVGVNADTAGSPEFLRDAAMRVADLKLGPRESRSLDLKAQDLLMSFEKRR